MASWWIALVSPFVTRPPESQEVPAFVSPAAFTTDVTLLLWSELTPDEWANMTPEQWATMEP